MNSIIIHYIEKKDTGNKFIIAKTKCGKHWEDINEFSTEIKEVNCKMCIKNQNKL